MHRAASLHPTTSPTGAKLREQARAVAATYRETLCELVLTEAELLLLGRPGERRHA